MTLKKSRATGQSEQQLGVQSIEVKDSNDGMFYDLIGNKGVLYFEQRAYETATVDPSQTDHQLLSGANMIGGVINTSSDAVAVYDGILGGSSPVLKMIVPPMSSALLPIKVSEGLLLRSLGLVVTGTVSVLYRSLVD